MEKGTDGVAVRAREERDVEVLVSILAQTHQTDGYPMWRQHVSRDWIVDPEFEGAWVAVVGDRAVGHAAVKRGFDHASVALALGRPASETLGITRLFVGSAARGLGAAQALMDVVGEYARLNGLLLALDVVDGSTSAISLYERRGWTRVATESAEWIAPDGSHPVVHLYVAPDRAVDNLGS